MSNRSCFVDTPFFLLYLTNIQPELSDQIEQLLNSAQRGELLLTTHSLVIVELAWTLESAYHLNRQDIQRMILAILNTPGLIIKDADVLFRASYLYAEKNMDIHKAYDQAWMELEKINQFARFQFKPFPTMKLEELYTVSGE